MTALERRQPDRVPLFECVIDERVMQALLPGSDYFAFNEWIGLDNFGLNRGSSWRRDNVQYVDEARGLFRDAWGVIRAFGAESTPYPVEGPIKTPADIKTYTPPGPEASDAIAGIPVLYLLGLPVARDMEGRVLTEMLEPGYAAQHPVTFIPSYEGLAVAPAVPGAAAFELPPLPDEKP